jgi:hypothetical protein
MNPMLRSLAYEQLLTYYNNMVNPKKGRRIGGGRKAGISTMQDAYMEIVARVEKAQASVLALEPGMRVMVVPAGLTLEFRVPIEATIIDGMGDTCRIKLLDGTIQTVGRDKCRAVLPEGVNALGRR